MNSERKIGNFICLCALAIFVAPARADIPANIVNPQKTTKETSILDKLHKLQDIDINGIRYLSDRSLIKASGLNSFSESQSGDASSIFSFSSSKIEESLIKLAWVRKVEIEKSFFPPKISINIEEEIPWFVLEGTKNNPSWLVGRSGTLLKPLNHIKESGIQYLVSSLPRLYGIWDGQTSSSRFSSAIFSKFRYATKSLRALEDRGGFPFSVSRFRILEEGGIEIEPESSKSARAKKLSIAFDNVDHLPDLLKRYALVRKDLLGRDVVVDKLDLRFKGRVVAVSEM